MNTIIRTSTKIIFPFILLFGIYILIHGHLTPGGTFSGGSIMVGAFVLYTLAFGIERTERELKEEVVDILKSFAGLVLVILIVFEFILRRIFLPSEKLFTIWSGADLLFFNIVGGVMVFTGLLIIWYVIVKGDREYDNI